MVGCRLELPFDGRGEGRRRSRGQDGEYSSQQGWGKEIRLGSRATDTRNFGKGDEVAGEVVCALGRFEIGPADGFGKVEIT